MSIVHISEDLKQEFAIDSEGRATVSIRGTARTLGIDESSLREACRAGESTPQLAELLTEHGIDPAGISESGVSDVALAIIAKYYAYKSKKKSKQAENFDMAMSAFGIRTWIQNQLGYQAQQQFQSPLRLGDIPKPPARHRKPVSMDSQFGQFCIIMMAPGEYLEDDDAQPKYELSANFSDGKMIDIQRTLLQVARDMEYFDLAMFPNDRTGFHCPDQDIPGGLLGEGIRVGALELAGELGGNVAKLAASQRFADKQKGKKKK